ncbi:hypothetical protein ACHHYP_06454, partial [Achlya hypogyna]
YGAIVAHGELNSVAAAIAGLRTSDACEAPWIFTPYCYLDFGRTWPVAHSTRRQVRCETMTANGAVYLDAVLRNVDWDAWRDCWGAAFDVAFGNELQRSAAGQRWLAATASVQTTVDAEAAIWTQHGIDRFDTQWQNYKRIGVMNSYAITNAYGISYPLALMELNGAYRRNSQTTYKMYWSLANDLMAVGRNTSGIGGCSLVRSSAEYAFANTTLAAVMIANGTLPSPLPNTLTLVSNYVGPFGVVDMIYVSVPPLVADVTQQILNLVRLGLGHESSAAQALYSSISIASACIAVPRIWLKPNYKSYGGSPLCAELTSPKALSGGFSNMLAYDLACIPSSPVVSRAIQSIDSLIVSAVLAGLNTSSNFAAVCASDPTNLAACVAYLTKATRFIDLYMPGVRDVPAAAAHAHVQALCVEFLLFTKVNASRPMDLIHTNVLDPIDSDFYFFGWLYLYDWVLGRREVVSFQGDAGALNLLTDYQLPLAQQVQDSEITTNLVRYCRAGVQYVTAMMLLVALLVLYYIVLSRGQFEGFNMFKLDRVGGIVWVGRPLLFLRSTTALCLLSTAGLELKFSGYVSYFALAPAPWYKVVLAAWEMSWLVAVVDDIFLVITQEYAAYYANINTIIVCSVAAIWTALEPVPATVAVDKKCSVTAVDMQILCTSSVIAIGQMSRFGGLLIVICTCHIISYHVAKWYVGAKPLSPAASLLLSTGARYHFKHVHRIVHGVYYLDRASAALTGLLTYRCGRTFYVLDIKLWRIFVVTQSSSSRESSGWDPVNMGASIPLTD